MLRFTVQRLLLLPLLLFVFSVVVFALIQAPPGDFLDSYLATLAATGSSVDAAQVEALEAADTVSRRWVADRASR